MLPEDYEAGMPRVKLGITSCDWAYTVVIPMLNNSRKQLQMNKYNYHINNRRE
jgi:hypothetical protein